MTHRWAAISVVALIIVVGLAGCFPPPATPDPNAPPEACGLPCDPDLNLGCPTGLQCISGVCLNEIVCNGCGQTCQTNADCPADFYCASPAGGPSNPKYCWSSFGGAQPACAQLTEDYCGYPCEAGDPQLGGYTCFNGALVSVDKTLCNTCGKNCTTNADCGSGTSCVQFPNTNGGGTTGFCWNSISCQVMQVDPDIFPQGLNPQGNDNVTPEVYPSPTGARADACNADGVCDPGENKDICGDADCPCIDDGVCGIGETAQCRDCITPAPPTREPGGDDGGGRDSGTCSCDVVCLATDTAGNCTERGYRDCNGRVCTP